MRTSTGPGWSTSDGTTDHPKPAQVTELVKPVFGPFPPKPPRQPSSEGAGRTVFFIECPCKGSFFYDSIKCVLDRSGDLFLRRINMQGRVNG